MWKVLTGILLATAVITGSVVLYPMRHRLFRPDVGLFGVRLARTGQAAATRASWTVTDKAGSRVTVSPDVQRSGLIVSGVEGTASPMGRRRKSRSRALRIFTCLRSWR